MQHKAFLGLGVFLVLLAGLGLWWYIFQHQSPEEREKAAVESVVKEFGANLQGVSFPGERNELAEDMWEHYGEVLAPELLEGWIANQSEALGRRSANTWPSRIEISYTEKLGPTSYRAVGEIIEVSSAEGGAAATQPIALRLENRGGDWLITNIVLGDHESNN